MDAINLLLNAVMPGAAVTKGAAPGQAAEGEARDSAGSEFRGRVLGLLDGYDAGGRVHEVRAGQQVFGQEEKDKSVSKDDLSEGLAQAECLLGSAGAVSEPTETALEPESAPVPLTRTDVPGIVTASQLPEGVTVSRRHIKLLNGPPEVVETAEQVPSGVPLRLGKIFRVGPLLAADAIPKVDSGFELGRPSSDVPAAPPAAKPDVAGPEVTPGNAKLVIDPEVVSQKAAVEDSSPVQMAGAEPQAKPDGPKMAVGGSSPVQTAGAEPQAKPDGIRSPEMAMGGAEQVRPASLGEREAGLTPVDSGAQPGAGPQTVVNNDQGGAARNPGQTQSRAGLGRSTWESPLSGDRLLDDLLQGAPTRPADPVDNGTVGRQTTAPQSRPEFMADVARDLPPVQHTETRHETAQGRSEHGTGWVPPSDLRLPGFRAADAVLDSRGQLPPEQVLGTKLIHQIVKAAKVQLTDGRADMALRLDPPHLGVVQMNVKVEEGVVTATLQTSTESAKQVLQSDLSALKQALADAGVNVDSINVSVGGNPNQGSWNPYSEGHDLPSGGPSGRGAWQMNVPSGLEVGPELVSAASSSASGRFDYLA